MPRAAVLKDDAFRVVEVTPRVLGPGEVRVRVASAGVNFWEVMQKQGRVPRPADGVLGTEGVGVVVETAPDVVDAKTGTRVAWFKVPGSFADEVVGPAVRFHVVPDDVDDLTAAGLLFQGVTAHYLAVDAWPLSRGQTAVVTAAAGGVGLLLTQLLADRGVRVIGVASTARKADAVLDAGAAAALDYGDDLVDRIRQVAPEGSDAVYDSVGGRLPKDLLAALRVRGALVLYGAASGAEADIGPADLVGGSRYLTRAAGRDYQRNDEEIAERVGQLLALAASRRLTVVHGDSWPLDGVDGALGALASRRTVGKLTIRM